MLVIACRLLYVCCLVNYHSCLTARVQQLPKYQVVAPFLSSSHPTPPNRAGKMPTPPPPKANPLLSCWHYRSLLPHRLQQLPLLHTAPTQLHKCSLCTREKEIKEKNHSPGLMMLPFIVEQNEKSSSSTGTWVSWVGSSHENPDVLFKLSDDPDCPSYRAYGKIIQRQKK